MLDYRPIPGGDGGLDLPMTDLTQEASRRASNLLLPYGERLGLKPIVAPPPNVAAAAGSPGVLPSMEDKLYQAVHPDTFRQVLETIMSMVTGKPISRDKGGQMDPGKTYSMEEGEQVTMFPQGGAYAIPGENPSLKEQVRARMGRGGESLPTRGVGGETIPPVRGTEPGVAGRGYELTVQPWVNAASRGWNALGEATGRIMNPAVERGIVNPAVYLTQGVWPEPTEYGGRTNLTDLAPGIETGPSGGGPGAGGPSTPGGRYGANKPIPREPGWKTFGAEEGITYKPGAEFGTKEYGIPVKRPDMRSPEALEIEARDRWAQPGYAEAHPNLSPGYEKTYYEAHPAEAGAQNIYDMLRGPSPDSYEGARERMEETNLIDQAKDPRLPKEVRAGMMQRLNTLRETRASRDLYARKAAEGVYGAETQFGGGSTAAETELRLAQAERLRAEPGLEMWKVSELGKQQMANTIAHVRGQIEAAEIGAGTRDQILTGLNSLLLQAQRLSEVTGQPSNPTILTGWYMRMMKNMGKIPDDVWAKMPAEWREEPWTEQRIRQLGTEMGVDEKVVVRAVERMKKAGKI